MTTPPDPVKLSARRTASRAESERLRKLHEEAAKVTPEEKAERRKNQLAAEAAAKIRRDDAWEAREERRAHEILKNRLRLFHGLKLLLPAVEDAKLVSALIWRHAYKQPEWSRAARYAEKPEILEQYVVDEPLDAVDIAFLAGLLMDKRIWGTVVEGVMKPLDAAEALVRVTTLAIVHNVRITDVEARMNGVPRAPFDVPS